MTTGKTSFMYPILMTAKVHVDMMGADANDVLNQYESLASALCKHKGLIGCKSRNERVQQRIKGVY